MMVAVQNANIALYIRVSKCANLASNLVSIRSSNVGNLASIAVGIVHGVEPVDQLDPAIRVPYRI